MAYSIVIPTRRSFENTKPLYESIKNQTFLPGKIFIIYDVVCSQKDHEDYNSKLNTLFGEKFSKIIQLVTNISDQISVNRGISYVRNYGIGLVETEYVLCIDDDNTFDPRFCETLYDTAISILQKTKRYSFLVPTEIHNSKIRSRGYSHFAYRLGVQKSLKFKENILSKQFGENSFMQNISEKFSGKKAMNINDHRLLPIQFSSSNCIFGPTKIFQSNPFDERMKFIYEDFDVTRRITKGGNQFYVMLDLNVNHNMRPKTKLEESYLADDSGFGLYEKAKNRIIFVKNTGSLGDRFDYYFTGLRAHTLFIVYKILRYAPKNRITKLLKTLIKGTIDGLRS